VAQAAHSRSDAGKMNPSRAVLWGEGPSFLTRLQQDTIGRRTSTELLSSVIFQATQSSLGKLQACKSPLSNTFIGQNVLVRYLGYLPSDLDRGEHPTAS
jgi:hypothetical protein